MNPLILISFTFCCSLFLAACTPRSESEADVKTEASKADVDASAAREIVGVDLSKYQGTVDFSQVKSAGIDYVFIRATDGITYQDPDFTNNFTSAKAAGITTGAYHFYETNDAPSDQLDNFTKVVTLQAGDLPPVVDIERLHQQEDAKVAENLQQFLDGLESHYGVKPIIYSGEKFANQYLTGFGDYPLWLAEYEVEQPTVPEGWQNWTFWQWSEADTISGIDGAVDADRHNGNKMSFQKLLIK